METRSHCGVADLQDRRFGIVSINGKTKDSYGSGRKWRKPGLSMCTRAKNAKDERVRG